MHYHIGQSSVIPKEVWGAFISGLIGVLLFFIKWIFDSRKEEKTILFRIYQLMILPMEYQRGENMDRYYAEQSEITKRKNEVTSLCLLLKKKKNRKTGRKIIVFYENYPNCIENGDAILCDIKKKINKKMLKEIENSNVIL